jgi:hypothetical protein
MVRAKSTRSHYSNAKKKKKLSQRHVSFDAFHFVRHGHQCGGCWMDAGLSKTSKFENANKGRKKQTISSITSIKKKTPPAIFFHFKP